MGEAVPFRLNDANMLQRIRKTAEDSSSVFLTPHARQQLIKRGFTLKQVIECLRKGSIVDHARMNARGNWQSTMQYRWAGDEINIAAALERNEKGDWIAVITVF